MENLPFYVYITFGATVLLAIWLFFKASHYSKSFLIIMTTWLIIQSIAGVSGFYSDRNTMTLRFPLLVLPPLIFIISLFITKKGRAFMDNFDLPTLTIFHIIRLPVELVLFWLFLQKSIPETMTFHGRNFDILSGISAPFIYYFGFIKKKLNNALILAWNFICLVLLLNVVSNALLSLPARFQQFGYEQPNIALGYFPFILLPALLVPLVLLSTLIAIRKLIRKNTNHNQ